MNTHELKCWPKFYNEVVAGRKLFDVRKNDRNFKENDIVVLREFEPCKKCSGTGRVRDYTDMVDCGCPEPHGKYTKRWHKFRIGFVLHGKNYDGIDDEYVVFSLIKIRQTR